MDQEQVLGKLLDGAIVRGSDAAKAYGIAVLSITVVISFYHWNRGAGTVLRVLGALSAMELSVKDFYVVGNSQCPKFATGTQSLVSSMAASTIMLCRQAQTVIPVLVPSRADFLWLLSPIAACFAPSVASSNRSLVYATAAFAKMVGATTPVVTVAVNLV